jgi:hypothetical protein
MFPWLYTLLSAAIGLLILALVFATPKLLGVLFTKIAASFLARDSFISIGKQSLPCAIDTHMDISHALPLSAQARCI